MDSSGDRPPLHAVAGGRADVAAAAVIDEHTAMRTAARAGDRHEPWTIDVDLAVRQRADEARAVGLDFDLALRLVVEAALAMRELQAADKQPHILDDAAARVRVRQRIDGASSSYLRRLLHDESGLPPQLNDAVTVAMPMRLSARLLSESMSDLVAAVEVKRARAWEIAALSEGRTISEWAAWTVLRGRDPDA